jgi:hypothetical protein
MKSDHEQDVASFTLFTQSFDTLSETGHFLRHVASSSMEQQHPNEPPRKIDVTAREDTSSWVGDISPIKLGVEDNYHAARSENHHHYDAHPPQPQILHYEEPHHDGYEYSSYGHAVAPRSNPFFVLRSAHQVFVGCSYLLPCLKNREICPISIGAHSSIRLCRDEVSTMRAPNEFVCFASKTSSSRILYPLCRVQSQAPVMLSWREDEWRRPFMPLAGSSNPNTFCQSTIPSFVSSQVAIQNLRGNNCMTIVFIDVTL